MSDADALAGAVAERRANCAPAEDEYVNCRRSLGVTFNQDTDAEVGNFTTIAVWKFYYGTQIASKAEAHELVTIFDDSGDVVVALTRAQAVEMATLLLQAAREVR